MAPYVRCLADEARALFMDVAPKTRHWATLDTLIPQFGKEFLFEDVGELKQQLGSRKYGGRTWRGCRRWRSGARR